MSVATPERGTKRECPETGRKFYDLNQNPIVSPFTGKSYPRSFFEQTAAAKPVTARVGKPAAVEEEAEEIEVDTAAAAAGAEVVSLNDAEDDDDDDTGDDDIPEVEDVEVDDDIGGDDDSFLETDDDDDDIDFDVGKGEDDR